MYVIITCKYEKNPIKNNREKVATPFLAHLSQRLIGDLVVYPWSSVRHTSSSVRPSSASSTMLKHLLLRNRLADQSQIFVEPPRVGGTNFCLRHLSHMTKMAATPIYGKNPSKSSPEPAGGFPRNLVCSIEDSSSS